MHSTTLFPQTRLRIQAVRCAEREVEKVPNKACRAAPLNIERGLKIFINGATTPKAPARPSARTAADIPTRPSPVVSTPSRNALAGWPRRPVLPV